MEFHLVRSNNDSKNNNDFLAFKAIYTTFVRFVTYTTDLACIIIIIIIIIIIVIIIIVFAFNIACIIVIMLLGQNAKVYLIWSDGLLKYSPPSANISANIFSDASARKRFYLPPVASECLHVPFTYYSDFSRVSCSLKSPTTRMFIQ